MVTKDLDRFQELEESCGSRYLAVQFISKWARGFGQEYKRYSIAESKLIQWVISGKCPYTEAQLLHRTIVSNDDGLEDFLCWVSDEEIQNEVKHLYKLSIKHKHLVYCKRADFTNGQVSRTNVLLRMFWFSSLNKEGE